MEIAKEKRDELEARIATFFEENNVEPKETVDITRLCNRLNIQVASLTFPKELRDEIDGLILVKGNEKKIGFNCDLEPRRARFVIAHELAHYITQNITDAGSLAFAFRDKIYHGADKPIQEHEMDFMAAAILVPKNNLKLYLDAFHINGQYTEETVKQINPFIINILADKFQVETDLIYRRILEVA